MDEIRGDIVNMLWPSWLTSVPSNFGSASHGKLKADHVEYTSLSRYVFSFTICSTSVILSHLLLHNHSLFTVTRIFVQVSTSYTS